MAGLLTDEEWIDRMYGPNADTPTSEIYRLLGLNPNLRRGTILPIARNEQGGIEAAVPNILIDLARAVRLPFRAISGKSYGFEDVANLALNFGALGSVATKPAGALASGAARTSKPSALPMDEASRMARAAEMGFDLGRPLYRGTVNRGERSAAPSFEAGRGVFMTDNPDVAEIFRYPREYGEVLFDEKPGDLQELYARMKNPLVLDERTAQRFSDDTAFQVQVMKEAAAKGHDGIVAPNVKEGVGDTTERGTTVVAMNPNQVRLRAAAFDPAKKDSADLLAGVIGLPGGSFLTGLNQERSKRGISKIAK